MRETQDKVCAAIEEIDGCKFRTDAFIRPGGGGGITRVMQGGRVWEKAGVAVSVVYGTMPAESYRKAMGNKDVVVEKVRPWGGARCAVLCRAVPPVLWCAVLCCATCAGEPCHLQGMPVRRQAAAVMLGLLYSHWKCVCCVLAMPHPTTLKPPA